MSELCLFAAISGSSTNDELVPIALAVPTE